MATFFRRRPALTAEAIASLAFEAYHHHRDNCPECTSMSQKGPVHLCERGRVLQRIAHERWDAVVPAR